MVNDIKVVLRRSGSSDVLGSRHPADTACCSKYRHILITESAGGILMLEYAAPPITMQHFLRIDP